MINKEFEQNLLKNIKNRIGEYESDKEDAWLIVKIIEILSDSDELISISHAEKILHDVIIALKETLAI